MMRDFNRLAGVFLVSLALLATCQVANATDFFFEDFESVALGPAVNEAVEGIGWTDVPPIGWSVDDSQVPGALSGDDSRDGRTEWAGWAFVDKEWWWDVDGQGREEFLGGQNTIAVADPDEWDDQQHDPGLYSAFMTTPTFSIAGFAEGDLFIAFNSGFRPECCDDDPTLFNDQSAVITASFDGAAPVEILRWSSDPSSPLYKTDTARDEYVVAAIDAPSGAESLQLTFGLERAENDWWWAIDNVVVADAVPEPSSIAILAMLGVGAIPLLRQRMRRRA
jgi:hypothetical protein